MAYLDHDGVKVGCQDRAGEDTGRSQGRGKCAQFHVDGNTRSLWHREVVLLTEGKSADELQHDAPSLSTEGVAVPSGVSTKDKKCLKERDEDASA